MGHYLSWTQLEKLLQNISKLNPAIGKMDNIIQLYKNYNKQNF